MLPDGALVAHRYRILGRLGRGATAQAYAARDLATGDEVALKVLRDARLEAQLSAEFERVREQVHPNLVRVRELSRALQRGRVLPFYSADLVRGVGLAEYASGRSLAQGREVLADVLEALHVLHALGMRHGDVKPDNVLVREDGRAVLLDLGCAAPLRTASSDVSGTPGYLAPELLAGQVADERADLYAFGVMLGELFADAPRKLVTRLCAADPARRPGSAREVVALLGVERDLDRYRLARPARFVGRGPELTAALAFVARQKDARPGPRALWIEGPDGVGRSRFLRELAARTPLEVERIVLSSRDPSPVRAGLLRLLGDVAQGVEGLVQALDELSQGEGLRQLVLDDADELADSARAELEVALRALSPTGRLSLVATSRRPAPDLGGERVTLSPLTPTELAEWAADLCAPAALWEHTGGFPREVERVLEALSAGRIVEADLARGTGADARREAALSLALSGLDEGSREVLARVVALGRAPLDGGDVLLARGLVRPERGGLVLTRAGDRAPLARLLDQRTLRRLHGARARELAQAAEPAELAEAVHHLFGAGEWARAGALFERAAPLMASAPRPFLEAVRGSEGRLSPGALVLAARAARLSGEPRAAISLLARARRRADPEQLPALYREAAESYLALGRTARALASLARAPEESSAALELEARLSARVGEYASALQLARRALELEASSDERARASETLALAEAYLGRDDDALRHVDEAFALHRAGDVRGQARCLAFRGFVLLRAGRVADAAEAYARTLALAEAHGLSDLTANALMNLGSARHSQGSYGAAFGFYERALRLSRALGRAGNERVVRVNLANLSLEIGAFARAEAEFAQLAAAAQTLPMLPVYQAELALFQGQPAAALARLRELAVTGRERSEARLVRGEAERALGDEAAVARTLSELADEPEVPADLDVRRRALSGQWELMRGRAERAVAELESALERARALGQEPLIARVEAQLARACAEASAQALATEHRARGRARCERMALDLPPSLRDAFWQHPVRRELREEPSQAAPLGRSTLTLSRLFDINRRLTSSLSAPEVLERALDAAIELTLAERGFVLLRREGGALEIATARHFGGEQLKRGEQKLSRSIAERVVESGEPLWTVDAGKDARFAQKASVHAMRLKSVLCVPIRKGESVLGALYLDNRLERARFAAADAELLLAFADQVAIALANARLVGELEDKTRELAREKRRVEELLRGKTEEVERLAQALSASRAALETRYDYAHIVGRSEPMRRVLAVIDRVVESDVNVLILGESGTGKELVARAIHNHGPRKAAPFVDLNCAALPEPLLEAELFGHVRGAFTGADRDREGILRAAHGGTVFLDELGEMSLAMQAKLLRVLVSREVRPVGGTRSHPLDVRILCATNRDLEGRVREGAFREDLYYRVAVVSVTLPPLRERSDDILPIAEALLARRAEQEGEPVRTLAPDARRALLAHPFPGNVRELENTLVRASVLASGTTIRAADLGLGSAEVRVRKAPKSRKDFEALEAERLVAALEAERWNVSRVARALGIPRNTLYRKLERYGIRT